MDQSVGFTSQPETVIDAGEWERDLVGLSPPTYRI